MPKNHPEKSVEIAVPIHRRVSLIVHNPVIHAAGGRLLSDVLGWNDPGALTQGLITDLRESSHGVAHFDIVERIDVDDFPAKEDGFRYTEKTFLASWKARRGFHKPDRVDYRRIIAQFDVLNKVKQGKIDEVWLCAFPYAGFYESIMAGPGAFWCNAPPFLGTDGSGRRFVIMGFNYERGVGEMLESFGHRAESIMERVFTAMSGEANLWRLFTRYDKSHPGHAEVGNVHYAPNSDRDYDWGNPRPVPSRCDHWYRFPDLDGQPRLVDCQEWGGGDIQLHHRWWYRHFPHVQGSSNGISHNWWSYVLDPNLVK